MTAEYPPETGWGGIAAYTHEMAHGLVRYGHSVTVISLAPQSESVTDDAGVTVHRVLPAPDLDLIRGAWRLNGYWPGFAWAAWKRLRQVHHRRPIDVVEAAEAEGNALMVSLAGGIPLVIRLHLARYFVDRQNRLPVERKLTWLHKRERWSIRHATALTAPGRAVVDLTAPWAGIDTETVSVIPNPINVRTFQPSPAEERQQILYAGRLETQKGMDVLAGAIPGVLDALPLATFILIGRDSGDEAGRSWAEHIRARVGPRHAGRVMLREAHRADMPALYASAAVCVIPSLWENFPYVALEAMASGVPVVASDVGGLREIVADGETGRLVPPGDSASLAAAIRDLLGDQHARVRMGAAARRRAEERYAIDRVVPEAVELYRRIAGQGRGQHDAVTSRRL